VLESEIVSKLVRENFEEDKWLPRSTTVWEQHDGIYVVFKSNDRINMPALDGRSGAPHPCMVSGERWTYAWPSISPLPGDAESDIRYSAKQFVICDNYHQYQVSKSQNVKIALGHLRVPWIGFQVYLKGGVRLIQEEPDAFGNLVAIQHYISSNQKYQIDYVKDFIEPTPPPDAVPAASCAHRDLPYGSIVADDFYQQLREVRRLDRVARRQERRRLKVGRWNQECNATDSASSDSDADPKRLDFKIYSKILQTVV